MRGRRPHAALLLAVAILFPVSLAAGCGGEEEGTHVVEGEPVELGELEYNVQITRFLNPEDPEDQGYLIGEPDPPPGRDYLGVFMRIENTGEAPAELPEDFVVSDTRDNHYGPVASDSPFALELGARVPPDGVIPAPDTTAASGPIKGALVLFLVDRLVTENRPLELEIPSDTSEVGRVELDI